MDFEVLRLKKVETKKIPPDTGEETRGDMRRGEKEFASFENGAEDNFGEVLKRARSEAEEAENSFKTGQTFEDCEVATNKLRKTYGDLRSAYYKESGANKKIADLDKKRTIEEIGNKWANCNDWLDRKKERETPERVSA